MKPDKVTDCWTMAAMAHKKTYENLITAVAEYALVKPLKVFGVSIALDETKERLSLPLDVLVAPGFSDSYLCDQSSFPEVPARQPTTCSSVCPKDR